jgi:transcriptional regulator of acetoin/glycerol metabolism
MPSTFARVRANNQTTRAIWDTGRMAQSDLVAALRAHRRAEERAQQTRADLDTAIRKAVSLGEWQIVDIAELTGWSRETIRKIANPKG